MIKTREVAFKMIDDSLKNIAISTSMLVNIEGVSESDVNEYINVTGNEYMLKIMKMSKEELLKYIAMDIFENIKSIGE